MTDAFSVLRVADEPIDPDQSFAARLRARLEALVLTEEALPMTATLTPYLGVAHGQRALAWYAEALGAVEQGERYVMPDGSIGHAELRIGGARLFLAEYGVGDGAQGAPVVSLSLEVPDVDAVVERAVVAGAQLERPVADQPYGRNGVLRDPFGHRWIVQTPTAAASPSELGYWMLAVPDSARAQAFFRALLGWSFSPGRAPDGWDIADVTPPGGLLGGQERVSVTLGFRVPDIAAAVERVRDLGGTAGEPEAQPYGSYADCTDDQSTAFWLLELPGS